jgi:hypothetical protein
MPRIIGDSYENGVLIECKIKGSTFKARKWLMQFAHIAIVLAVLAVLAVHFNDRALQRQWVMLVPGAHPGKARLAAQRRHHALPVEAQDLSIVAAGRVGFALHVPHSRLTQFPSLLISPCPAIGNYWSSVCAIVRGKCFHYCQRGTKR